MGRTSTAEVVGGRGGRGRGDEGRGSRLPYEGQAGPARRRHRTGAKRGGGASGEEAGRGEVSFYLRERRRGDLPDHRRRTVPDSESCAGPYVRLRVPRAVAGGHLQYRR